MAKLANATIGLDDLAGAVDELYPKLWAHLNRKAGNFDSHFRWDLSLPRPWEMSLPKGREKSLTFTVERLGDRLGEGQPSESGRHQADTKSPEPVN